MPLFRLSVPTLVKIPARQIAWTLIVLAPLAARAEEAETSDVKTTPTQLVAQLGAEAYTAREAAEAQILQRGEDVLTELQKASTSPDPEIRIRASLLLNQLTLQIRRDRFARFVGGSNDVDLPGWATFQKRHGDSSAVRKLFISMLDEEWDLLINVEQEPRSTDYLFYRRAVELRQRMYGTAQQPISLGSIAAMLHAASHDEAPITPLSLNQVQYLLSSPDLSLGLQNPDTAPAISSVFDHWLKANLKAERFSTNMQFLVLMVCLREKIESGVVLAKSILDNQGRTFNSSDLATAGFAVSNTDQQLVYALLAIGKLGSEADIPYLESMFQIKDELTTYPMPGDHFETQLRDVALLAAIHLAGKDPQDFGFARLTPDPNYLYSYRTIGFSQPEQREAAFEKWQQAKTPAESAP